MTDYKPFDYSRLNLPANEKWMIAAEICHKWLSNNMTMFNAEKIGNFMLGQPGAAAQRLIDNCPDFSEESITVALLGPARDVVLQHDALREALGIRAVSIIVVLEGLAQPIDAKMRRDVDRANAVTAISMMNDQMIGRKQWDKHMGTRYEMLAGYEEGFAKLKTESPDLDKLYQHTLLQARKDLDSVPPAPVHPPKPNKPPGL